MIDIEKVDHIGIRVADVDRALNFYKILGFKLHDKATNDDVVIIRTKLDVEINLIYNANNDNDGKNILMDVGDKYPGYTHLALRVGSIKGTIEVLKENGIRITQGPVSFDRSGHVSIFVRDPDRNVIELRGREEDLSSVKGLTTYVPKN
ncbi:MAG: VOC family protein [Deltaproteobacteria bacterium]|nr:VOC family protein [Deltaproteobacteria bacterium]MCZ6905842.1 VOC family protein [Deltaproteobacteria bacterium]